MRARRIRDCAATSGTPVIQTGDASFDVAEILKAIYPGVADRPHRLVDLVGERFGRGTQTQNLWTDRSDIFGEITYRCLGPRVDRVSMMELAGSSRARRDVHHRSADQRSPGANLRVGVPAYVGQSLFENLGCDEEPLESVRGDRSEGDVIHQSLLLSAHPDFRSGQHAWRFIGDDVQGHFLAVKRAHPGVHQDGEDQRGNHCRRYDSPRQVSPVELVGHPANINTGFPERLSYGAYMTGKETSAC